MNKKRSSRGFTLVEIMIVVLIIGILLAIAVPNFIQARKNSRTKTIVTNLREVEAAKTQCAMEDGLVTGDPCADVARFLKTYPPQFPVTGAFQANTIGTECTFRGKDAASWLTDNTGL